MTSEQIHNGGPAFPQQSVKWTDENGMDMVELGSGGMSLRDWFAGQALIGLLAESSAISKGCAQAVAEILARGENTPPTHGQITTKAAYFYADAMLAARKEQP